MSLSYAALGLSSAGSVLDYGLNFLGSLLGSNEQFNNSKKLQRLAYLQQLSILKIQQDFAKYMSNTAHQREVNDLRKAGLNPILTATGGNGATSPVVSASAPSTGHVSSMSIPELDVFSSLRDLASADQSISSGKASDASAKLFEQQAKLTAEQVETEKTKQDLNKAQALKAGADASTFSNLPGLGLSTLNKYKDQIADFLYNKLKLPGTDYVLDFLESRGNSSRNFKPKKKRVTFDVVPAYELMRSEKDNDSDRKKSGYY